MILWGPPGVGKTTLAHVISHAPGRTFVELSAITAGVKDVRQVIENARREREMYGRTTVLFLDEIHRFSKAQQDALPPAVENRLVVVAATTENPSFSVISPPLSRSLMLTLRPLGDDDISTLLDRAMVSERGLAGEFELAAEAKDFIVRIAGADARRSLTILEAAPASPRRRRGARRRRGQRPPPTTLRVRMTRPPRRSALRAVAVTLSTTSRPTAKEARFASPSRPPPRRARSGGAL